MAERRGRAAFDSTQGLKWRHTLRAAAVLLAAGAAAVAVAGVHAARPSSSPASSAASAASGATTTSATTTTAAPPKTHLTGARATQIFLSDRKVASWLHRYPTGTSTSATYSSGVWQVNVFYGPAGEIASGKVNDLAGDVTEAFTGPQVAWGMARGGNGFGGKKINEWQTWLIFCVAFLLGLVDWRRPFSLRTVDLLALLSFSPSLWFFNHGRIFAAISLVYPGFAWLIGRCLWIAHRDRGSRGSVVWPTWVLVAATLCLAGYRIDLNINHSNVIDVGLSGVIGADRIARFQDPVRQLPRRGRQAQLRPGGRVG